MSEEQQAQQKRDVERVKAACATLMEFFDSVQIFATRHNGGDNATTHIQFGDGPWFTRYGQIQHWMIGQNVSIAAEYGRKPDES